MRLLQKKQESFKDNSYSPMQCDKVYALHLIQGSSDAFLLDIPRLTDADPAFFKLVNSEAKILRQILLS